MITKYGFSVMGPISLENSNELSIVDGFIRNKSIIADNTYSKIDNEIINISKIALNNAINIISNNRILLEKLVELLIIKETIENNIFKKISFDLIKVWLNIFNLKKYFLPW